VTPAERLRHELTRQQAANDDLAARLAIMTDNNRRLGTLIAKLVLSDGAEDRALRLSGPHDLPIFHLTTEHFCGPTRDDPCDDVVQYHRGNADDCAPCREAIESRQQQAVQRHNHLLPGRPYGMAAEDRN
jgi:hypothetical protein